MPPTDHLLHQSEMPCFLAVAILLQEMGVVTTHGVTQANFTLPMRDQRREALDDLIAYLIKMKTETVLADDAEGRDGGSNG